MSPPKYVDLIALAAALVVFVVAGLPMVGFAVGAGVWLAQRGIQVFATRRANEALANGNRQKAMGMVAATTLGRVWLMATAVLVVGLTVEREAGLSAAVLVLCLFTLSMAAAGVVHLFEPEGEGAAR
jgi:hypothetical protein